MSSCNNQNDQMLRDADISVETQLCDLCSNLFSAWDDEWIGYQTHHEGYESLLRSVKAGCHLCEKLKDVWDHSAAGIQDPMCRSFIDFSMVYEMSIRVVSEAYSLRGGGKYYGNFPLSMISLKEERAVFTVDFAI